MTITEKTGGGKLPPIVPARMESLQQSAQMEEMSAGPLIPRPLLLVKEQSFNQSSKMRQDAGFSGISQGKLCIPNAADLIYIFEEKKKLHSEQIQNSSLFYRVCSICFHSYIIVQKNGRYSGIYFLFGRHS